MLVIHQQISDGENFYLNFSYDFLEFLSFIQIEILFKNTEKAFISLLEFFIYICKF